MKQEAAIPILLTSSTVEAAAEKIGVGPATVYRWLVQPEFKERIQEARCAAVEGAVAVLQQASRGAAAVLISIMANPTAPASVRVTAARTVLEQAISGVEFTEIVQRLERIEDVIRNTEIPAQ